jgi:hypothetical protein
MAGRRYPFVLVCKETAPSWEPFLDHVVEKVVYNDTEYHSFLNHHSGGYMRHDITERRASWKELKGNLFKRIYDWAPKWAVAVITFIVTYIFSNLKDIWLTVKSFIHY